MRRSTKTIATIALAASTVGISTQSASAYSVSGGSYTGTATTAHTFTFGGVYTISCSNVTYTGTATGAASTSFTPSYSGCSFFGLPAQVTVSGSSTLTVVSNSGGDFHVTYHTSSTITVEVPSTGCVLTVGGTQEFTGGWMRNYAGGVDVILAFFGISYTASGCPFSSGSDGTYNTNGNVTIPGITVT